MHIDTIKYINFIPKLDIYCIEKHKFQHAETIKRPNSDRLLLHSISILSGRERGRGKSSLESCSTRNSTLRRGSSYEDTHLLCGPRLFAQRSFVIVLLFLPLSVVTFITLFYSVSNCLHPNNSGLNFVVADSLNR